MPDRISTTASPHRRQRWRRWLIFVLLALGTHQAINWILLRSLDTAELQPKLEEWAHAVLYTDVAVKGLSADLDLLGCAELKAARLEIGNPNVMFEGALLRAGPVAVASPVWGLWGFRIRPGFILENARVQLAWDAAGEANFAGLCSPLDASVKAVRCPLGQVNARTMFFEMPGAILDLRSEAASLSVMAEFDASLACDIRRRSLWGALHGRAISGRIGQDKLAGERLGLDVSHFACRQARDGGGYLITACQAAASGVPLSLLSGFCPGLPALPSGVRCSGKLRLDTKRALFAGMLEGLSIAAAGLKDPVSIQVDGQFGAADARRLADCREIAFALAGSDGNQARAVLRRSAATGCWDELELELSDCDAAGLPPRLAGVPDWLHAPILALSSIRIAFRKLSFASWPAPVQGLVCRGGGTAVVRRMASQEGEGDCEQATWDLHLQMLDLRADLAGAGALVQEFARLGRAGLAVEVMRRRSLGLEPLPEKAADLPPAELSVSRLSLRSRIYADGMMRLSIHGTSPELGSFAGGGEFLAGVDGKLTGAGTVSLRQLPGGVLQPSATVSTEIIAAIREQCESEDGLRIDVLLSAEESQLRRRYEQDIFMIWTRMRAQREATP